LRDSVSKDLQPEKASSMILNASAQGKVIFCLQKLPLSDFILKMSLKSSRLPEP